MLHTDRSDDHRRHLVVVRVGDRLLHPTWVQGERSFDLVVDYYGDTPGKWAGTADLVLESKGSKWQGLHAVLSAHPRFVTDYDAVWFPDDDIATDAETISAAFALHDELGTGLSQPALTADSYFTHLLTLAHPGLAVRVTNFVEVMVPMFSREALAACWETFAESRSGFGLDLVWQALLPGLGLRSAIFDCLTVTHTRPLGTGSLYDGMEETPAREGARVARAHGMPTPTASEVFEVLDVEGRYVRGADAEALVLAHLPVPTVQGVPAWDLYARFLQRRADDRARGVRPAPLDAVQRPATAMTVPDAGARFHLAQTDLAGAAHGAPVVLLVGAGASARAAVWKAAGWSAVAVTEADLPLALAAAERHPVRALDVAGDDADTLERAVERGASAGAVVVVRVAAAVLACHHRLDPQALAAVGRCEACALQRRAIAAASAALVCDDAVVAQQLADAAPGAPVVEGLDVADLAEVASLAGLPPVEPLTVVVLGRDGVDPAPLLASLADQQGLTAAGEVVVVPAGAGPAGLAEAAAAARHDRVLLLEAGDLATPWCVADHRRASDLEAARRGAGSAGGVVVSAARAPLAAVLDVLDSAVQGAGRGTASGDRASAPSAALAGLAASAGLGTARTAALVLERLAGAQRLPAPTHEAAPTTSLDAERSAAVLAALTAGALAAPEDDDARAAHLVHWSHLGGDSSRLLAELVTVDEPTLRWSVMGLVTGERGLDVVRSVVHRDLLAHVASADLAVSAVRRAAAAGRPWALAVDAADERLVPLLAEAAHQARSGELDPTALRVVAVLDPDDGDERAFAQHLAPRLAAAGTPLTELPFLEVVTSTEPASRWRDADVATAVPGQPWFRGLPVPLLGLPEASWLGCLDLVALAARAEAPAADPAAAPAPVTVPVAAAAPVVPPARALVGTPA